MRELAKNVDWTKKYSDYNEDLMLRCMFPYQTGHYVEIGVWDYKNFSNTYYFYELGWDGVLIEPMALWARQVQAKRPRDKMIIKAISNTEGNKQFRVDSACSSLDLDWSSTQNPHLMNVNCVTLENALKKYPEIRDNCDFCSLDVEGHEREVLLSNNWETFKPRVWVIEAVEWNPFLRTHGKWEDILLQNGYKLIIHNIQNRFYGRIDDEELWKNVNRHNMAD